jgi:hypothetical protein
MTEPEKTFSEWVILELLGHVRLGGLVTEEERFVSKMGRIDVPMKYNVPQKLDRKMTKNKVKMRL